MICSILLLTEETDSIERGNEMASRSATWRTLTWLVAAIDGMDTASTYFIICYISRESSFDGVVGEGARSEMERLLEAVRDCPVGFLQKCCSVGCVIRHELKIAG